MARYMLTVADRDSGLLESWLGGGLIIAPAQGDGADPLADLRAPDGHVPDDRRGEADRRLAALGPVAIAGLDAVTDEETMPIRARLARSAPLYHSGGPGQPAERMTTEA